MRILVVGGGGREHTLAWKLSQEGHDVYCAPGNAGTAQTCTNLTAEQPGNEGLLRLVEKHAIDFTVVGPEAPLSDGIVDLFEARGHKIFGPTQRAAQLESSKAFSKDFMARHKIPTARYTTCHSIDTLEAAVHSLLNDHGVVIKASGLCAGKGVTVARTAQEAIEAGRHMMEDKCFGTAGEVLVVEECLHGPEVSIQMFCDGEEVALMPPAQDHKRLSNGDEGPNTGGMGAFAPTPTVDSALLTRIHDEVITPTHEGLIADGIDYRGVLYVGLMLTEAGPKVLEYNCRFGDPETQVVIPLMQSDLAETLLACAEGLISDARPRWQEGAAATVVMASAGYPGSYETGKAIHGLEQLAGLEDLAVFHAGTSGSDPVVTNGGRVLAVTGVADTVQHAAARAYEGIDALSFEGAQYRTDIGMEQLAVCP